MLNIEFCRRNYIMIITRRSAKVATSARSAGPNQSSESSLRKVPRCRQTCGTCLDLNALRSGPEMRRASAPQGKKRRYRTILVFRTSTKPHEQAAHHTNTQDQKQKNLLSPQLFQQEQKLEQHVNHVVLRVVPDPQAPSGTAAVEIANILHHELGGQWSCLIDKGLSDFGVQARWMYFGVFWPNIATVCMVKICRMVSSSKRRKHVPNMNYFP